MTELRLTTRWSPPVGRPTIALIPFDAKIMMESGESARKNKIGIYSEKCSQTVPPNAKCRIKANINGTYGTKFYYTPDCGIRYDNITVDLFRGDQWFCTEKEAQATGFAKTKLCE